MIPVLIGAIALFGGASIILAVRNVKLKASNTKLKVENNNLQYDLGTSLVKLKEVMKSRQNTNVMTMNKNHSIKEENSRVNENVRRGR